MKNMKNKLLNIKGFTLIELLVVVTIIVILSAVGMTSYRTVSSKARDSRRKADLEQIRGALELYRADEGNYPTNAEMVACGVSLTGPTSSNSYMTAIPCDPKTEDPYDYNQDSNVIYTLLACLEVDNATGICVSLDCATLGKTGQNYCIQNP